jgi:PilZ domain
MSEEADDSDKSEPGMDLDEAEAASERRGDVRHLACFPAHVETAEGVARSALIRDLSVSGALLLTRARLRIGDLVKLSLYLKEGAEPFAASGRVVREEKRPTELSHPWTKAVAVHFDEPLAELEAEAKALAERQAALAAKRA